MNSRIFNVLEIEKCIGSQRDFKSTKHTMNGDVKSLKRDRWLKDENQNIQLLGYRKEECLSSSF